MKKFLGLTAMAFLWTGKSIQYSIHNTNKSDVDVIIKALRFQFTFSAAFLPIFMDQLAEQIVGFGLYVLPYEQ